MASTHHYLPPQTQIVRIWVCVCVCVYPHTPVALERGNQILILQTPPRVDKWSGLTILLLISWKCISQTFSTMSSLSKVMKPNPVERHKKGAVRGWGGMTSESGEIYIKNKWSQDRTFSQATNYTSTSVEMSSDHWKEQVDKKDIVLFKSTIWWNLLHYEGHSRTPSIKRKLHKAH